MKKTLIIKLLALVIGSLLLIRFYFIASGIPVSVIAYSTYNDKDYKAIIHRNPQHAYAYEKLAESALANKNLDNARYYSDKALKNNLSNGGALAQLVEINDTERKVQRATEAAQLSAQLWPAHALSMQRIANHWIIQNQPQKAMIAWDVILTQNYNSKNARVFTSIENIIFSVYEKVALQENTEGLFTSYHKNPPTWWMHYFRYLINNPNNTNNLKAITQFYQQQVKYNPQFPTLHRNLLLKRLGKEHKLKDAYYLWLSSLNKNALAEAKLLYNGGFEGNVFNEGFAWLFGNMSHVYIYQDSISRLSGNHSLHIAFNKWVSNYLGYLHQPLVLSAGKYTLNFSLRSRLSAEKGLVWTVHCINDFGYLNGTMGKKIATSSSFKGDLEWKKQTFTFTIPNEPTCPAQGLFLDTTSGSVESRRVRGDIWFDDMTLVPEN